MQFSCKISNAILSFLDEMGLHDLSVLESFSVPEEFLRDPSYWLQAQEMETLLERLTAFTQGSLEHPLCEGAGHKTPNLRAWGVLDSVLRMMPSSQEILSQPERFLAYFVSPGPPVDGLSVTDSGLEFDLPISADQYPLTTQYLRAALEALPIFLGQPMAQCRWEGIHIAIDWGQAQATIFSEDPGHKISPDLMRTVMQSLEQHQRDLEEKNRELLSKNEQLRQAQAELERRLRDQFSLGAVSQSPLKNLDFIDENSIERLLGEVSRLGDYLVRAQQLITLLVGQDRMSPAIKAAMKRVDWERVQLQFPQSIRHCREILEGTQKKQNSQEERNV